VSVMTLESLEALSDMVIERDSSCEVISVNVYVTESSCMRYLRSLMREFERVRACVKLARIVYVQRDTIDKKVL